MDTYAVHRPQPEVPSPSRPASSGASPTPGRTTSWVLAALSLGTGVVAVSSGLVLWLLPAALLLALVSAALGIVTVLRAGRAHLGATATAVAGLLVAAASVPVSAVTGLSSLHLLGEPEAGARPGSDELLPALPGGDQMDDDVVDAALRQAHPLGATTSLGGDDVAVLDVHATDARVADRLAQLGTSTGETDLQEAVLVDLAVTVSDRGDSVVLDGGLVGVMTRGGDMYSNLSTAAYVVDEQSWDGPVDDGEPQRAVVTTVVAMPPQEAADGLVVVAGPDWQVSEYWAIPAG